MFHQILPSPQVKQSKIAGFNYGIYELPHEVPSDLRLRNLGNYEILRKCLNIIEWLSGAESSWHNKSFVSAKNKVPKKSY